MNKKTHLFDMKTPCEDCPFRRTGGIELRPGRLAEIVRGLVLDDHSWFHCHKDVMARQPAGRMCVGSMIYLLKIKSPNLAMRLAASHRLIELDDLRAQYGDIVDNVQ